MTELESLFLYIFSFAFAAAFIQIGQNRLWRLLLYVGFVLPILLAAYRYMVGTDFVVYISIYNRSGKLPLSKIISGELEVGFFLINKILSYFEDVRVFFGFFATLTLIPVYLRAKQESQYATYSIGLFCFLFLIGTYAGSFNILRQVCAVAITFYASGYIFKKQFKKYVFYVVIASLLHTSALIAILAYFLYDENGRSLNWKSILIITGLILLIGNLFAVINLTSEIHHLKYLGYVKERESNNFSFFLSLAIFLFFLFNHRRIIMSNDRCRTYLLFSFIALLFGITGFFNPIVKRVGLYFSIYNIFLFCYYVHSFVGLKKSLAQVFLVLFFIFQFTLSAYILHQGHLIPYNTKTTYYATKTVF